MNQKQTGIAIAAVCIAMLLFAQQPGVTPAPKPDKRPTPRPEGPNLVEGFRKTEDLARARKHALALAAICDRFAHYVEVDGQQPKPRLTNGVHFDDYRISMRKMAMDGYSFARDYPDVADALDRYLMAEVGEHGGPIDADLRRRWVTAYRNIAACSKYASENLQAEK